MQIAGISCESRNARLLDENERQNEIDPTAYGLPTFLDSLIFVYELPTFAYGVSLT